MNPEERLTVVVAALESVGLSCLVMGGHAVRYYGLQRHTNDFDLTLAPEGWDDLVGRLARTGLFPGIGPVEGNSWRPGAFRRFLAGTLHHPSPLLAGATAFIVFASGAAGQMFVSRRPIPVGLAIGTGLMLAGLAIVVLAVWLPDPSLALFLVGSALAGAGSGCLFKAVLTQAARMAPPWGLSQEESSSAVRAAGISPRQSAHPSTPNPASPASACVRPLCWFATKP